MPLEEDAKGGCHPAAMPDNDINVMYMRLNSGVVKKAFNTRVTRGLWIRRGATGVDRGVKWRSGSRSVKTAAEEDVTDLPSK